MLPAPICFVCIYIAGSDLCRSSRLTAFAHTALDYLLRLLLWHFIHVVSRGFVRPLPCYFAPLFLSGLLVVRSVERGPFVAVVLVLSPVARGHTHPVRFLSRALHWLTYFPNGAVSGPIVLSWINSGRSCLFRQSLCELFQSIKPDLVPAAGVKQPPAKCGLFCYNFDNFDKLRNAAGLIIDKPLNGRFNYGIRRRRSFEGTNFKKSL